MNTDIKHNNLTGRMFNGRQTILIEWIVADAKKDEHHLKKGTNMHLFNR